MKFTMPRLACCATLLFAITVTAGAQETAAEKQRKLIEILKSDAPPAEKAITCKRLAVYGSKDAVPVLAPLLADEHLASWARIALEAIPDPAADEALRDALGKLQGRLLIGVINTIGVRRDTKAIPALAQKLSDANADVASAAAMALGRIGGEPVAKILSPLLTTAPAGVRSAVGEGSIRCAEGFLNAGQFADAVKLYDAVRAANISKPRTIEATRGAILARRSAGVPLLVEQLRSNDKAMVNIGLRVARELRGPEVTKALLAEWDRSGADRQAALLLVLADRGDAEALTIAVKTVAAKNNPTQLRLVAVGVIDRAGNASAVPVLLAATAEEDADLAQAAKSALGRMPGAEVDTAVVALLKDAEPKTRRLAIELLTQRRIGNAVPALLKSAQDSDEQVRLAAFKALSDLASIAELPAILDLLLASQSPAEIQAAESAVTSICARNAKPVTGNIVIVKAVYGDLPGGPQADFTKKVAEMIKSGSLAITASNANFGDPAGGRVKKLRVDYTVEGQPNSKTVAENDTLTITGSIVSPACAEAVFTALPRAKSNPKLALLRILRSMGGPQALAAVRAAATDPNAEVSDTALRALCDWPNADALADLARLAKSSANPTIKILALRGYIRLASQLNATAEQKLAALQDALALAERDEEKKLALAALGNIPTAAALAVATAHIGNAALKEEASLAAVTIAEQIPQPRPPAVAAAMEQVAAATANAELAKRARALTGK